jgi:hypothetical protein
MNSRRIEERYETQTVKSEWEPSERVNTKEMSDEAILAWVRAANKRAKAEEEYIKFRSVYVEDNW